MDFRVALPPEADQPKADAIASLPGMTPKLFNGFGNTTLATATRKNNSETGRDKQTRHPALGEPAEKD